MISQVLNESITQHYLRPTPTARPPLKRHGEPTRSAPTTHTSVWPVSVVAMMRLVLLKRHSLASEQAALGGGLGGGLGRARGAVEVGVGVGAAEGAGRGVHRAILLDTQAINMQTHRLEVDQK